MIKKLTAVAMVGLFALPMAAQADEALAKSKACLACHQVNKKVVGPAFSDVAAKYKDVADARAMLIDKVKNGGKGNWGQIPMPKQNVTDEEAAKLVDWLMGL
jgi:cytochrome c